MRQALHDLYTHTEEELHTGAAIKQLVHVVPRSLIARHAGVA